MDLPDVVLAALPQLAVNRVRIRQTDGETFRVKISKHHPATFELVTLETWNTKLVEDGERGEVYDSGIS